MTQPETELSHLAVHDPLLTASEAADYCRVSKTTINELRRAGKLPCIRITADARYRLSDLNKLIENHQSWGWMGEGEK